jgi:23S rRNA pseudouridine1911/1915/1917 synthase
MGEGVTAFRVDAPGRADRLVGAKLPGRSRQALARAFDAGLVRVNGRRARKGQELVAGDWVEVGAVPTADDLRPRPQPELALAVLYSDDALVALDKPAGVPSHPLAAGELGTLANALVARFPECAAAGADPREAGLAHRLDAGTSGVIVAARARAVWDALRDAFRGGRVLKTYLALVVGVLDAAREIDAPIAHDRSGAGGVRVGAREGAQDALTEVEPVERFAGGFTLVRCRARTGRMHQVRAHLAWAGFPVAGDARYGGPDFPGGAFLHAAALALPHPVTGVRLALEAPLPDGRRRALDQLR